MAIPRAGYLRISVTDRCNQRCIYCMPESGVPLRQHDDILRFEEIERLVRIAAALGVRSVRLTGGEPLVRRDILTLAGVLSGVPGVEDLALTTNGLLLADTASSLKAAGVSRVNLSLDTLDEDKYRSIARIDGFRQARAGLEAALAAGFSPVKVNTVVIRGVNDEEIEDMAMAAAGPGVFGRPVIWRFIELMPLGEASVFGEEAMVPADEILGRLQNLAFRKGLAFGPPVPDSGPGVAPAGVFGAGPARYFRLGQGLVGVISPMTHGFCSTCNRLRLTSDGRLHPCLTSPLEVDLAGPLRQGASDEELAALFDEAMGLKPKAHRMRERPPELAERRMFRIGG